MRVLAASLSFGLLAVVPSLTEVSPAPMVTSLPSSSLPRLPVSVSVRSSPS